jgi:hypothetical protein
MRRKYNNLPGKDRKLLESRGQALERMAGRLTFLRAAYIGTQATGTEQTFTFVSYASSIWQTRRLGRSTRCVFLYSRRLGTGG